MILACRTALTNSVYLQAHQHFTHAASLLDFALKLRLMLKLSTAGHPKNMKGSRATLAHADLELDPCTDHLLQHEGLKK